MTSEKQVPSTRIIIAEQTLINLLQQFEGDNQVPSVVEFAMELDEAEAHGQDMLWYNTSLAEVLVAVSAVAQGADAGMTMLEFRANTIDKTGE